VSLATKEQFKKFVTAYHADHQSKLALHAPVFEDDGFLTTAMMSGCRGNVAFICGPAEYHVELFIYDKKKSQQLSLRELIAFSPVRDWMRCNRASIEGKQRLQAEIEYAFRLLVEAISVVPRLNWLLHDVPPPALDLQKTQLDDGAI
jgi:hypothetical protein